MRRAVLEGPLQPGTRFRCKAGPGTVTSTLRAVTPPREIAWTGSPLGLHAVHVWRIEPQGDRRVVHTAESGAGLLPRLFRADP